MANTLFAVGTLMAVYGVWLLRGAVFQWWRRKQGYE
jgi:hypothetical protein